MKATFAAQLIGALAISFFTTGPARADNLPGAEPANLFVDDSKSDDALTAVIHSRPGLQYHATRVRIADLSPATLERLSAGLETQVRLNLFENIALTATIDRFFPAPSVDVRAAGRIDGIEGSCFVFVLHNGAAAGNITAPGIGLFDIRPIEPGRVAVREINLTAKNALGCGAVSTPPGTSRSTLHPGIGPDGRPNPQALQPRVPSTDAPAEARGAGGSICPIQLTSLGGFSADDGSVVDIMFYYTPAALTAAGSVANIESELALSITYANNAYVNSEIDVQLNAVRFAEIAYVESNDAIENLDRLVSTTDGILDNIHAERDQYGGDLVCLCVDNVINAGGVAYQLFERSPFDDGRYGFSVMREDNATFETLAHEVGHNFGCQHDRCNPSGTPFFDFGWGYRQPCPGPPPTPCSTPWPCEPNKDIMCYPPGITVPYFSNPDVLVGGQPIGGIDEHGELCDNATAHRGTAFTVANFRPSTVTPAPPSRIYVNAAAASGGDGHSWATALNDLQEGIGLAVRSRGVVTEVWVAEGLYRPDRGSNDRSRAFRIANGVSVFGGFVGTETLLSERNVFLHPATMSGDIGTPGDDSDNSYHVVYASDRDSTAVLDGFIIEDGHADGEFMPFSAGGGMLSQCTNSTIRFCTLRNNSASFVGGALYSEEAPQLLATVAFESNSAAFGGGAEIARASPTMTGCRFTDNTAEFAAGAISCVETGVSIDATYFGDNSTLDEVGFAGAIRCGFGSTPTISFCLFEVNESYAAGALGVDGASTVTVHMTDFAGNRAEFSGAVEVFEHTASFTDCEFISNMANSAPGTGHGGAITVTNGSTVTLTHCELNQNVAGFGGGGVVSFGSTVHATECLLIGNRAWYGAGTWSDDGESRFANSRFLGNRAENGGGGVHASTGGLHEYLNCQFTGNRVENGWGGAFHIYNGATATIDHCTLASNLAPNGEGGGLLNDGADVAVRNSIFWQNSAFGGTNESAQIVPVNVLAMSLAFNDVQNWSGTLGDSTNFAANPLLADVNGADNILGNLDDNTHLLAGSPCIEASDPAFVPYLNAPVDLDGEARILACRADLGADEFSLGAPGSGDMNSDLSVDLSDVPDFVNAVLNGGTGIPFCIADMNQDDVLDGLDLQPFTDAVIAP